MGIQAMNVHHLPRGLIWDHDPPSLTLGCKRFRPLAPKLSASTAASDLKSFIRPQPHQCTPTKPDSSDAQNTDQSSQLVEAAAQAGGTRWNPTQEQIGILEMLYRSGMRTPNAQQIEQITLQLGKYGKIEGKNVFYWFQNHKARERQKQKRTTLSLSHYSTRTATLSPPSPSPSPSPLLFSSISKKVDFCVKQEEELVENDRHKRKCMRWDFDDECLEEVNKYCRQEEEEEQDRTLKLFPLHPEGRSSFRDH